MKRLTPTSILASLSVVVALAGTAASLRAADDFTPSTRLDPAPPTASVRYVTQAPDYPAALRRRGAQAAMLVRVDIDERGRVVGTRPMVWVGERRLVDHACAFGRRSWRGVPRTKGGKPVRHWVRIPVQFCLDGREAEMKRLLRAAKDPYLRAMADRPANWPVAR